MAKSDESLLLWVIVLGGIGYGVYKYFESKMPATDRTGISPQPKGWLPNLHPTGWPGPSVVSAPDPKPAKG
jgi:hypothetical protein